MISFTKVHLTNYTIYSNINCSPKKEFEMKNKGSFLMRPSPGIYRLVRYDFLTKEATVKRDEQEIAYFVDVEPPSDIAEKAYNLVVDQNRACSFVLVFVG